MSEKLFTVATFNCNSVRKRLPIVTAWLNEHKPDLLALQETKVQDPDFPLSAFMELGYHVSFRGIKSYNGVATLTRQMPNDVLYGFNSGADSDDFRLIQVVVNGIRIVNSYVPQGYDIESEKYQYKLKWYQRLRKYFDRHLASGEEIIWLGDLNVAPEAIDVANPEKNVNDPCFHVDARKEYQKTVEGRFIDVFRDRYPNQVQYTFWDFFRNAFERNRGWRIDHILATPQLAARCQDVKVDLKPRQSPSPSDHTVVVAKFDLGPKKTKKSAKRKI